MLKPISTGTNRTSTLPTPYLYTTRHDTPSLARNPIHRTHTHTRPHRASVQVKSPPAGPPGYVPSWEITLFGRVEMRGNFSRGKDGLGWEDHLAAAVKYAHQHQRRDLFPESKRF